MRKKLLTTLFFSLICGYSFSQSSDALLDKLVEKNVLTSSEAEEVRREVKIEEKKKNSLSEFPEKTAHIFNTPHIRLGGYGQFLYTYSNTNKNHNDFRVRNAHLSIDGIINDKFRYGVLVEFVDPTLVEYWAEWTAAKEFNFKIGQFKIPFTMENQFGLAGLETVTYSRTVQSMAGYGSDTWNLQNGKNNAGRDVGIQASGNLLPMADHDLLQYAVGVFQGSGINTSDKDNTKDIVGSAYMQPIKGLRIGGGAHFGEATYTIGDPASVKANSYTRNRWAVSTDYRTGRFYGRAEYLNGKDANIKKEGAYGLLTYYLKPQTFNVLGKVNWTDENKSIDKRVIDYTIGMNYFLYKQCRVQLNYTYSDYDDVWSRKNDHSVTALFQIVY